eukprot:9501519-Pyramimonas_sp.AAC.1
MRAASTWRPLRLAPRAKLQGRPALLYAIWNSAREGAASARGRKKAINVLTRCCVGPTPLMVSGRMSIA